MPLENEHDKYAFKDRGTYLLEHGLKPDELIVLANKAISEYVFKHGYKA